MRIYGVYIWGVMAVLGLFLGGFMTSNFRVIILANLVAVFAYLAEFLAEMIDRGLMIPLEGDKPSIVPWLIPSQNALVGFACLSYVAGFTLLIRGL